MMRAVFACGFVGLAGADVYMHAPRGSNNRLNEKSANRNNGNRLFDSQNNNRGGYNVGDMTDAAFANAGASNNANAPFNQELSNGQYSMMFYEGSLMNIEWTAQHGCGGSEEDDPHKLNCNMVLQYACNTRADQFDAVTEKSLFMELKDGRNTNTPDSANNFNGLAQQTAQNDANGRGRHESESWYYECERRPRNMGLFTADQKLKGNKAKYTRQNPNGNRRGLECPEERDYFPWWNPSPWVDVAVFTDNTKDCSMYQTESQNVKDKCWCVGTDNQREEAWKAMTKETCDAKPNAQWYCTKWDVAAPVCMQAARSRVNHLGNVVGANGDSTEPASWKWQLPKLAAMPAQFDTKNNNLAKCVFRLRYNISTDDYDPKKTDASFNQDVNKGRFSPVQQNPTVDVGASLQGLKLAINTAQFGRTFQDRSHTFYVAKADAAVAGCTKIHNLNVRGKRGNIVQTFPSVEYDFIPNKLDMASTDCIVAQWTGSNTHNNGNPAGDGQAGDAGEGTGGTDRQNIASIPTKDENYPIIQSSATHAGLDIFRDAHLQSCTTFTRAENHYTKYAATQNLPAADCAVYMASNGYYNSVADSTSGNKAQLNVLLNNAYASMPKGAVLRFKPAAKGKTFHYMCTRNNNFSNRSQKGQITIN